MSNTLISRLQSGKHGRILIHIALASILLVGLSGTAIGFFASKVHAASPCQVNYTIQSQWPGGFTGSIIITNTSSTAINGWTLAFPFPATGQTISQGWNATWTQSGLNVIATNLSWNRTLAPGAPMMVGFNGTWATTNPAPTNFTINGQACGGSNTPTPTNTPVPTVTNTPVPPPPGSHIVVYTASGSAQAPLTVSASCQPGEQMLGGGFISSNVFEYDAYISASYPSSPSTWTVSGNSSSSFILKGYVYCLQSNTSLGVQIIQGSGNIACPSGTTIVSGGFKVLTSNYPIGFSRPNGNGWATGSYTSDSVQGYALCAVTSKVSLVSTASLTFNVHSSLHVYSPGSAVVTCPTGSVTVGGGFDSSQDLMLTSNTDGTSFSTWNLTAGGDNDVTGYAVCILIANE
jgi:Cellulose binding domain